MKKVAAPDRPLAICFRPNAVDHARSSKLVRIFDAQSGECYKNGQMALHLGKSGCYVEGLVVCPTLGPIGHGWLEMPDGSIVDPTPRYCDGSNKMLIYVEGQRWTYEQSDALFRRSRGGLKLPLNLHSVRGYAKKKPPAIEANVARGWREAITAAHEFWSAYFRAQHGTSFCGGEEQEARWLEYHLNEWPRLD